MKKLIVVRHGYSVTNASNRFTGQMDVSLTEIGYLQADALAKYLVKNEKIDKIVTSDLSRAVNTALPTARALGLPIHQTPKLRELGMGIWEGMLAADVRRDYADLVAQRAKDATVPCPGGESFRDMFVRVKDAIDEILRDEADTVLTVTHGGAFRCIDCIADGGDFTDAQRYKNVDNASITVFLIENGRMVRTLYNFTDHLKDGTTADRELL
ncbi:MAG: histidine phosphatase family protein [Clostridia bacterium]|nr:histidine phosphatase family protein [Clostridia bacterium]